MSVHIGNYNHAASFVGSFGWFAGAIDKTTLSKLEPDQQATYLYIPAKKLIIFASEIFCFVFLNCSE